MDLRFKTNLLEHLKPISDWAAAHGANAYIDAQSCALAVQKGDNGLHFNPQFVGSLPDGSLAYFPQLGPQCMGFVGWLPYPVQTWEVSGDKLVFKGLMQQLGLRTPENWVSSAQASSAYIVKPKRSAFGYGIHGPYLPLQDGGTTVELAQGEFIEAFKPGRIARAWYWTTRLCILEMFDMQKVYGDGQSTFEELLANALPAGQSVPSDSELVAQTQGYQWDQVVPAGSAVIADYRYVSPLNPTVYANHNRVAELGDGVIGEQFKEAGLRLWSHLPGSENQPMAYVIDAIVDDDDLVWFLEVNSNAQMHPDIYPHMLNELLPVPG